MKCVADEKYYDILELEKFKIARSETTLQKIILPFWSQQKLQNSHFWSQLATNLSLKVSKLGIFGASPLLTN
jgi:hypothetical protein